MEFENSSAYNFEGAFRGMRAPMKSWNKSDSYFGIMDNENVDPLVDIADNWVKNENIIRITKNLKPYTEDDDKYYELLDKYCNYLLEIGVLFKNDYYPDMYECTFIGPNDLALAQKLIQSGAEHAKFLRQIFVTVDITAPRFWWAEMDTYKVGTTANSTSTMHKLTSTPITINDFEITTDKILRTSKGIVSHSDSYELVIEDYWEDIITMCEDLRQKYIATKDKNYWRALIEILPQSYLQTRTWTANYAVLRNIYFQRKNHKLIEWHQFCDWIKTLPYGKELITLGDKE